MTDLNKKLKIKYNKLGNSLTRNLNTFKFAFIIFYILFIISSTAHAAPLPAPEEAARKLAEGSPISEPGDIFRILKSIVQWVYLIFFFVAIIFILLAAFNFLTAKGDPEKVKGARSQILWATVAIAIALISVAAAQIIDAFLRK